MQKIKSRTEYEEEFEPCGFINAAIGNVCRIVFIDGDRDRAVVKAVGDPTFISFFLSKEKMGDYSSKLRIHQDRQNSGHRMIAEDTSAKISYRCSRDVKERASRSLIILIFAVNRTKTPAISRRS